jgi:hypothetical protein
MTALAVIIGALIGAFVWQWFAFILATSRTTKSAASACSRCNRCTMTWSKPRLFAAFKNGKLSRCSRMRKRKSPKDDEPPFELRRNWQNDSLARDQFGRYVGTPSAIFDDPSLLDPASPWQQRKKRRRHEGS